MKIRSVKKSRVGATDVGSNPGRGIRWCEKLQKIKIIIPEASSVAVIAEMISRLGKKDFK